MRIAGSEPVWHLLAVRTRQPARLAEHLAERGIATGRHYPEPPHRSAAYACRYLAKNVVAAGLAERCTIQLSYAIGVAEPLSVHVDLHRTGKIDEHILDGDVVVVHGQQNAENGEMVIALVNGTEATVKKFYREQGGWIRLQPANAAMQPLRFQERDVLIQGIVVGVIRKYT